MATTSVAEESYGDSKGPASMYVRLVASDGRAFVVERELAVMSETLKDKLSYPYEEDETQEVVLRDVSSASLDLVCKYLTYKRRYSDADNSAEWATEWAAELQDFKIAANVARELLSVAHFLRI